LYDATETNYEGARLAQPGKLAVRLDERLLRGVLRFRQVAEQRERVPHRHVLTARDECAEGLERSGRRALSS
jgi:hypothetical protein